MSRLRKMIIAGVVIALIGMGTYHLLSKDRFQNHETTQNNAGGETPPEEKENQNQDDNLNEWGESKEIEDPELKEIERTAILVNNFEYVQNTYNLLYNTYNKELTGWINFPPTQIGMRIMESDNREYYKDRDGTDATSNAGQGYILKDADEENDHVYTIYNYSNGDMTQYDFLRDYFLISQSEYEQHRYMIVYHLRYAEAFEIDGAFNLKDAPDFDIDKRNFENEKDFEDWYSTYKNASTIQSDLKSTSRNKFLVIVCSNKTDNPYVVVARRITEWRFEDYKEKK